uniref:Myb-like domain-containing protein n=1 Tax=Emiliania huxleyi TaxID=2903 RepID=A0A7S3X1A8_EMIHU|mmetsp:Transcript_1350/g.4100  ORF Transcript_1350/g.4100 Transcript_1350/m.4100 type:complete len:404 (-) Transcript_1350:262-1473(-)
MLSAVTPAEVNAIDPPAPPDASPEPDERPPAKARKRPRPTERCGWAPEADKWVAHGYETLGPCWTAIAALLRRETGEDRSGDSVRNRVLRLQQQQGKADDRGGDCWTTQEVDLICQGVLRGLRWKDIADMLPGRTESSCRNRWVRHKQKELSGMGVEAKTAVDVDSACRRFGLLPAGAPSPAHVGLLPAGAPAPVFAPRPFPGSQQMAPHQLPQPSQLPPPCQLPQYNQLSAQRWVPGPLMGLPMAQAMPMPPSQLIPMWGPPQYVQIPGGYWMGPAQATHSPPQPLQRPPQPQQPLQPQQSPPQLQQPSPPLLPAAPPSPPREPEPPSPPIAAPPAAAALSPPSKRSLAASPAWDDRADDQAALSAEDRYRARLRLAEKEGRLPQGVVARILGSMVATPSAA